MMVAHKPIIEPTEMSISPVMMMRVIGRATIEIGMAPASAIDKFEEVSK